MQSGLMEQKLSNNRDEGQLRDTRFQKQFCQVVASSKFLSQTSNNFIGKDKGYLKKFGRKF